MYQLKQKPEDFVVEEVYGIESGGDSGRYAYFILKKREYTTMRALQQIAHSLRIPLNRIGFAGTKDKIAVTTQLISIENVSRERAERLELKDIELTFYGRGDEPLSLGDLKGNRFEIMVRNIQSGPVIPDRHVNYFGVQRFSKNNVDVARFILKKDFRSAAELIMNADDDFRRKAEKYLADRDNDYIGTLRLIPKKILMLYIHSYQSYVWNESVRRILASEDMDIPEKVPIVGFSTRLTGTIGHMVKDILDADGITQRDFVIRSIPELTSEGDERDVMTDVQDIVVGDLVDDDMNDGMRMVKICFRLPKGCYATEVIEQMFLQYKNS